MTGQTPDVSGHRSGCGRRMDGLVQRARYKDRPNDLAVPTTPKGRLLKRGRAPRCASRHFAGDVFQEVKQTDATNLGGLGGAEAGLEQMVRQQAVPEPSILPSGLVGSGGGEAQTAGPDDR